MIFLIPKDYRAFLPGDNKLASDALEKAIQTLSAASSRLYFKKKCFGSRVIFTANVDVNGAHRLVFEQVRLAPNQERALVLIGIVINHKYEDVVRKTSLGLVLQEEVVKNRYNRLGDAVVIDGTEANNDLYHQGRWVEMTSQQSQVLSESYPHWTQGPPGAGKTMLVDALLQEQATQFLQANPEGEEKLKLLYVSGNQRLNRVFEKSWEQWLSLLRETDRGRIQLDCKTYADLVVPDGQAKKVNREEIVAYITKLLKNYNKEQTSELKAEHVLAEIGLSAYVLNHDIAKDCSYQDSAYARLGIAQVGVKEAHKEVVYAIYAKLKDDKLDYPGLTDNASVLPAYDFACADEVQSATVQEALNVLQQVHDNQVVFFGDSYQRGVVKRPTGALLSAWLYKEKEISLKTTLLSTTYRLTSSVTRLCNELVLLVNHLLGGKTDSWAYSSMTSAVEKESSIHWCGPETADQADWQAFSDDADLVAVVFKPADKQELVDKGLRKESIFLLEEIRGLQFDKVILFLSEQALMDFSDVSQRMSEKKITPEQPLATVNHGSANKAVMATDAAVDFEILSALMTAISRSCGDVWIYTALLGKQNQHRLNKFMPWLKARCLGTHLLQATKSTDEDWLKRIHQFIDNDDLSRAQESLRERFDLTADLAQRYVSWYQALPLVVSELDDTMNGLRYLKELKSSPVSLSANAPSQPLSLQTQPGSKKRKIPLVVATLNKRVWNNEDYKNLVNFLQLSKDQVSYWLVTPLADGETTLLDILCSHRQHLILLNLVLLNHEDYKNCFSNAALPHIHKAMPRQPTVTYFQAMMTILPENMVVKPLDSFVYDAVKKVPPECWKQRFRFPQTAMQETTLLHSLLVGPYIEQRIKDNESLRQTLTQALVQLGETGLNQEMGDRSNLLFILFSKPSYNYLWDKSSILRNISKAGLGCSYRAKVTSLNQGPTPNQDFRSAQGFTPLFILCATPNGRLLLKNKWDYFKTLISRETLAQLISDGEHNKGKTPFYYLCANPEGRQLLYDMWGDFNAWITPAMLTHSVTGEGPENGTTPFYYLYDSSDGYWLLIDKWNDFKPWITPEMLAQAVMGEGPNKGKTHFYYLCTSFGGRELLKYKWDEFKAKITQEMLTQFVTDEGPDKGKTPFYCLYNGPGGLRLLIDKWNDFKPWITPEMLAQSVMEEGPDKGKTHFYYLCTSLGGRQLLAEKWDDFKPWITPAMLAQAVTGEGPDKGKTPFLWLCGTPDGRQILKNKWDDFKPWITSAMLEQSITGEGPDKGKTPFYYLCANPDGRRLLYDEWDDFKHWITPEMLAQSVTGEGPDKGKTLFSWLYGTHDGRQLLHDRWDDFKPCITPEMLAQFVTDEGPCKGETHFYYLCASLGGRQLLTNKWDDFKPWITPAMLAQSVTGEGPDKGKTPFLWLCGTPDGRQLLKNKWDDFKPWITPAMLEQSITGEGPDKEKTPFYYLCVNLDGRELLKNKWNDFKHWITPKMLEQPVTSKESDIGKTLKRCLLETGMQEWQILLMEIEEPKPSDHIHTTRYAYH